MSATNAAKAKRAEKQIVRCYYLVTEEQAAELEQLRMALSGLGQLACNDADGENFDARVDRTNLQALIDVFARRLNDVITFTDTDTIWANKIDIQQASRP